MKKCSYCGKEYDDSTSVCAVDGKPLDTFIGAPIATARTRGTGKVKDLDPNLGLNLPMQIRHNRRYLLRWMSAGVFFVLLGLLIWSPPIWTRVLGALFVALGACLCWYAGRRLWDKRVKLLITTNGLTYHDGRRSTFVTWQDVTEMTFKASTRTGLRYTSAKIIIHAENHSKNAKNSKDKEIVLNVLGLDPGPDDLFEILKSLTDSCG